MAGSGPDDAEGRGRHDGVATGDAALPVRAYHHVVREAGLSLAALGDLLAADQAVTESAVAVLRRFGLVDGDGVASELRAVNPVVRMASLVEQTEQALRDHEGEVQRLKVFATAIADEYRTVREEQALTAFERLTDPADIVARLEELYAVADRELRIFVTNRQDQSSLEEAREKDAELLTRGLRVRLICLESVVNHGPSREYISWLSRQGAEYRVLPTLPLRMIVRDEDVAVVAAHADDPSQGAVLLRGHGVVHALIALFERCWTAGTPIGEHTPVPRGTDGLGITPVQQEVLRLMAAGAKDNAIARQLDVSVRTVRRICSELTTVLGATSRFTLGVEAARRGWLDDSGSILDPLAASHVENAQSPN